MATEGTATTTNAPPAYKENPNSAPPPAYSDNPNTDPNNKSALSLNDESTRFTLYATIFLAAILMNMVWWGYMMDDSDEGMGYCAEDDSSWWSSSSATECEWLYMKFSAYTIGLAAVLISFLTNYIKLFPLPPVMNIVSGVLLGVSGLLAAVGQGLMVDQYIFSMYAGYCIVTDDDTTIYEPRTCCYCEPAGFVTFYALLAILIAVDMVTKIGNSGKMRLTFYFSTYFIASIFFLISYFDEEAYPESAYEEAQLFQLAKAGLIVICIVSAIALIFAIGIIPLSAFLSSLIRKILAVAFGVSILNVIVWWLPSWDMTIYTGNYQPLYRYLYLANSDSAPFMFVVFAGVAIFELITLK